MAPRICRALYRQKCESGRSQIQMDSPGYQLDVYEEFVGLSWFRLKAVCESAKCR